MNVGYILAKLNTNRAAQVFALHWLVLKHASRY